MTMAEAVRPAGARENKAEAKKATTSSTWAAGAMKKKLLMSSNNKKTPTPGKEKEGSGGGVCRTTKKQSQCTEPESPSYRLALKSLFSCRNSHGHHQHQHASAPDSTTGRSSRKLGCSAPSICRLKDDSDSSQSRAAHDDTVASGEPCKRRASVSGGSERCVKKPLRQQQQVQVQLQLQRGGSSSSSSAGSSFRASKGGMQLRRLSGCYECHMVVDPVNGGGSSSMRATVCPCPDCGEIFVRQETLQLHQSIRHAVCELGADDTSRNIIEIIFQSSWLKKQSPVCKIERILKVHNTARTLARFEEYRDAVKAKASKQEQEQEQLLTNKKLKHPRCTADGNELLRFHCATMACSLGLDGATHLCLISSGDGNAAGGRCGACAIIRDGFIIRNAPGGGGGGGGGVLTMATSGRAHDAVAAEGEEERSRAMLVCRVIAGRVKRAAAEQEEEEDSTGVASSSSSSSRLEEFDSVAGSSAGVYSNLEELQVFNPRAILPCFVVVYRA